MGLIDYTTIIVDLDFTVWDGCEPTYWAKKLAAPLRFEYPIVYGADGKWVRLQDGVRHTLHALSTMGVLLGFASRGGRENTPFDEQPSAQILRAFEMDGLFTYCRVLVYKTFNKGTWIQPHGHTLYIDDSEYDLRCVHALHGKSIDYLNRLHMTSWEDALRGELRLTRF